jgi:hypothetical protein
MTFAITLGWWIVPTLITLITYVVAMFYSSSKLSYDPFAAMVEGLAALLAYGAATIVSLISWVIYLVVV